MASGSGSVPYVVSKDCSVGVWNVSNGERIKKCTGHSVGVSSVAFSPDGEYLVSGSYDNNIGVWKFFD